MHELKIRPRLILGLFMFLISSLVSRPVAGQNATLFQRNGTDSGGQNGDRPESEQYDNRAFPEDTIAPAQQQAA